MTTVAVRNLLRKNNVLLLYVVYYAFIFPLYFLYSSIRYHIIIIISFFLLFYSTELYIIFLSTFFPFIFSVFFPFHIIFYVCIVVVALLCTDGALYTWYFFIPFHFFSVFIFFVCCIGGSTMRERASLIQWKWKWKFHSVWKNYKKEFSILAFIRSILSLALSSYSPTTLCYHAICVCTLVI